MGRHASAGVIERGTWFWIFWGVLQHEGGLSLKGSSGRMSPQRQDPLLHNDTRLCFESKESKKKDENDDKTE